MKKMKLDIFDPPMCCSSGVCGPNVNPALVKFASDLEWMKTQYIDVMRYDLSSNPAAFASRESIKEAIEEEGTECLPLVLVNGYIVSKSRYPSSDELITFLEIAASKIPDVNAPCNCKGGGQCC